MAKRMRNPKRSRGIPSGKLTCAECGRRIHRGDRFIIVTVRHRDCRNAAPVRNALSAAQGLFARQDEAEDNQGPAENDDVTES